MKTNARWYSPRLEQEMHVVRWGFHGVPLLLFPTAGGDAEECERFLMIRALEPLIGAGRLKVYTCDSVAGRCWIDSSTSGPQRAWTQRRFMDFVRHEMVPAIRADCRTPNIDIVTAGASIGAYNALHAITAHPDVFSHALCMSGTFDLSKRMNGAASGDFHFASPLHFVPYLGEGDQLNRLRQRMIILATGEGRWENPGESWRVANILGAKGIPNRVDLWGPDHDHDWPTWREMLPKYLDELTRAA